MTSENPPDALPDSDAKPVKSVASKVRLLSPAENALLDLGFEIASNPPTTEDFAFAHSILCQVGLPRSRVTGDTFLRQSGNAWINIQAGYLDEGRGPVKQEVPFGAMPRLAMAFVSTYAVLKRTREVPIGDSAREFLSLMGMTSGGSRYTSLRKQMHSLAAARLQLGFKGRTFSGQPIEQFDAWQTTRDPHQRALWPGVMVLSDNYYSSLIESAVPLDKRALHALKGTALGLDIYTWLAHRLHRIEGKGVLLHWKSLREQFGQEYTGDDADKNFKKAFMPALKQVLLVYPRARVKKVPGGLVLIGSPPPISTRA